MTDVTQDQGQAGAELSAADEQVLQELTERARTGGLKLTGQGGLLGRLTKMVVEGALEGELDDHLGYGKHDPEGRDGGNSRNGHRAKTVLTDTGPVEISVPRDRDASFEPKIIAKRQRATRPLYGCGSPPRPRRPPQNPQDRRELALDQPDHYRLAAHPGHPAPALTSRNPSQRAGKDHPRTVEPRPPGPTAGPPSYPGTKIQTHNPTKTTVSGSHQPP